VKPQVALKKENDKKKTFAQRIGKREGFCSEDRKKKRLVARMRKDLFQEREAPFVPRMRKYLLQEREKTCSKNEKRLVAGITTFFCCKNYILLFFQQLQPSFVPSSDQFT
jgi:hypothetical protein